MLRRPLSLTLPFPPQHHVNITLNFRQNLIFIHQTHHSLNSSAILLRLHPLCSLCLHPIFKHLRCRHPPGTHHQCIHCLVLLRPRFRCERIASRRLQKPPLHVAHPHNYIVYNNCIRTTPAFGTRKHKLTALHNSPTPHNLCRHQPQRRLVL